MKHLILAFILIVLCLGQIQPYAQERPNSTKSAAPTTADKPEMETKEKTRQKNNDIKQTNEKSSPLITDKNVTGHEVPILSRSDKIAKKANFWAMLQAIFGLGTLILAGVATCYARRAWVTSRDGGIAQFRPVLTFENIWFEEHQFSKFVDGNIIHSQPADLPDERVDFHLKGLVTVKNWGTTPVYQVSLKAQCEASIVPTGRTGSNNDLKTVWSPASFLIPMLAPSEEKEVEINIWIIGESPLERQSYTQNDGHIIDYIAFKIEEVFLIIEGNIYFQDIFTLGKPLDEQRIYKARYAGFPLSKTDVRKFLVFPEEVHQDWQEPEKPKTS